MGHVAKQVKLRQANQQIIHTLKGFWELFISYHEESRNANSNCHVVNLIEQREVEQLVEIVADSVKNFMHNKKENFIANVTCKVWTDDRQSPLIPSDSSKLRNKNPQRSQQTADWSA